MVDIMDIYKSLNITIGTVMKNRELLKFVTDHLKTKKISKHAVKLLPYLLRYFPSQYRIQQMCDKPILENGEKLKFVPECYKNHKLCNKAIDNYTHALECVPKCYKTQKMCDKAVNRFLDQYKTQEI